MAEAMTSGHTYLGQSAGLRLGVVGVKPAGEGTEEAVKLLPTVPGQGASDRPYE